MTSAYCTRSDVYNYGVPRGGLPNRGRLISSVNTTSDVLTLEGHGFEDGDEVTFRAEGGGSLPSPLASGTTYFAIYVSDSQFQISTTAGGSAVNLTTSGSNLVVTSDLPWDRWIAWASELINEVLTAHVVPIAQDAIPERLRAMAADLVAGRALAYVGAATAELQRREDRVRVELDIWRRGIPLRGTTVPSSASLAVVASGTTADPRGWYPTSGGGTLP